MTDVDGATVQLAELLRHTDDLDKIPALKAEFTRKKAAVDAQLKAGLERKAQFHDNSNLGLYWQGPGQDLHWFDRDRLLFFSHLPACGALRLQMLRHRVTGQLIPYHTGSQAAALDAFQHKRKPGVQ